MLRKSLTKFEILIVLSVNERQNADNFSDNCFRAIFDFYHSLNLENRVIVNDQNNMLFRAHFQSFLRQEIVCIVICTECNLTG